MKSKLIRNLKRGDKVRIVDLGSSRSALVEVIGVQEIRQGHITRRRRWEVKANYPFWWGLCGIVGYSNDRIDVVS